MNNNQTQNLFTVEEAVAFVKDWNFSLGILLLLVTIILQYGYTSRSMFVYVVKMFILWLMWPLTIFLAVVNCVYPNGTVYLAISCIVAIVSIIMWIMYFVNSIRLFSRTGSWWSFNPETNLLVCLDLRGKIVVRPILEDHHTITVTIIRGHLYLQGVKLGNSYSLSDLPPYLTVARVTSLVTYKRAFLDKIGDTSGFAIFVKHKVGNYRLPSAKTNTLETALLRDQI
nr:membrane protein [Grimso virus]